ncbi:terpenoid synthase, partial [Armillaria solidipes]
LEPYLTVELNIAASAYHHLANDDVKVYIAFFTAFATYFDDTYPDDPDTLVGVPGFTKHFASLEKQPTKMLDNFANLLAEAPHCSLAKSLLILLFKGASVTVSLASGLSTHQRQQTHKVDRYALFLRDLSGMPEAYTVFIFPKGLPYNLYIQALPLLCEVVNFMNDITSFYKEECENETHNLISLLAEARGEPKNQTLRYLVERCIQAHERTLCILSPHEGVRSSYESFVKGYLAFHLGAKRYRLSELDL